MNKMKRGHNKENKLRLLTFNIVFVVLLTACTQLGDENKSAVIPGDTLTEAPIPLTRFGEDSVVVDSIVEKTINGINTRDITPQQVVAFAHTLQGVPYKYASIDPTIGFDCSGFITYVFRHFDIAVPRSSVDFTNEGREVKPAEAVPGDLILFTGTDSTVPIVGHMGIVTNNNEGDISFIHSTSGKAYGVTITPLNQYYKTRFVKVIRVFPEEYQR